MKSVCLIAKGPSAIQADEFIDPFDDIAVINDAGIFTSRNVDYAFCTHNYYTTLKDTVYKIKNIVTLAKNVEEKGPLGGMELLDEVLNVNKIIYQQGWCKPEKDGFIRHIAAGKVCHHHTATAALHWLSKFGKYDLVKVIGIDGGTEYAPGSYVDQETYDKLGIKDGLLDQWKEIMFELVKVLENIYDCQFKFYNPS